MNPCTTVLSKRTHTYTQSHARTHTHIHECTHAHTHTHTLSQTLLTLVHSPPLQVQKRMSEGIHYCSLHGVKDWPHIGESGLGIRVRGRIVEAQSRGSGVGVGYRQRKGFPGSRIQTRTLAANPEPNPSPHPEPKQVSSTPSRTICSHISTASLDQRSCCAKVSACP